jgi:hypothetical protein
MLGGDAWVDSIGAVVCHDKWRVHGAGLANSKLLLHMMRVQAIDVRYQSQNACHQSGFHAEDVRREDQEVTPRQVTMVRSVCRYVNRLLGHTDWYVRWTLCKFGGARKDRKRIQRKRGG